MSEEVSGQESADSADAEYMQTLYTQAVAAHEKGDAANAVDLYGEILVHFPDADLILYNQGLALFELERFAEAAVVLRQALRFRQDDADTWYNLALALKQDQLYPEAIEAYKQALILQPDNCDVLFNLANCCRESRAEEEAAAYYTHLLGLEPEHASALNNFAYLCHLRHDYSQAEQLYQRLLDVQPGHPGALHMLAALAGTAKKTPEKAYVQDLFDQYSDSFEQSLKGELEYRVPELLFDLVCRTQSGVETEQEVLASSCLDLGCGTGLAGKVFKGISNRLVGVDLSEKMIARAAEKGVYERLVAEDVVFFLEQEKQEYDLLVAADLLTYLADLEPLFYAAFQRTAPGGFFVFSTEHGEPENWQVRPTGRFAHHPQYVLDIGKQSGWRCLVSEEAELRREASDWVLGDLFLFVKSDC
jgi:predicted TPR repeat methyltransferase